MVNLKTHIETKYKPKLTWTI